MNDPRKPNEDPPGEAPYHYVDTEDGFLELANQLCGCSEVAVDIEHHHEHSFRGLRPISLSFSLHFHKCDNTPSARSMQGRYASCNSAIETMTGSSMHEYSTTAARKVSLVPQREETDLSS